ncbi:MAG: LamG-like jellyroll fold domain-containing protein, partial [Bacteroidota bacterium]
KGNFIGTDATGTVALNNGNSGVGIYGGASNNIIGGNVASARNLISGNNSRGIWIGGSGTDSNTIAGNYIGTDINGINPIPNDYGVFISEGAMFNIIGGDVEHRNLISGNNWHGIVIRDNGTDSNRVSGNHIGTDASGNLPVPNNWTAIGIHLGAKYNLIGGHVTNEYNLISGNNQTGIGIDGIGTDFNIIEGNLIGTNGNGTVALPNNGHGVDIQNGAKNNQIGNTLTDHRNIISGNLEEGISISAFNDLGTDSNIVVGNYIGTDISGMNAIGNVGGIRIVVGPRFNIIGGFGIGERNIISGNNKHGITIYKADYNSVIGNFIGTNRTGADTLGNTWNGIAISDTSDFNLIENNIIGGNYWNGISIGTYSTNNKIISNRIGIDSSGSIALSNSLNGVVIENSSQHNIIGGDSDSPNIIAFSGMNGVVVDGVNTKYNRISKNSIFRNTNLGINLQSNANGNISTPVIVSVINSLISGTASQNALIEIFADSEEEGKIFLDEVVADGNGNFSKQLDITGIPVNYNITATQTSNNNTSKFSAPFGIPPLSPQNLNASAGNMKVILSWNRNNEPDLLKYNIYRGTSSPASTLISSTVDTNYTDNNVTPDVTYFYRLTAVDSSNSESGFSNEVNATPFWLGITVLSPNGGEQWQVGTTQNITWTSSNVTNVKIEYTTNNGTSWLTVSPSTTASLGSFSWTIPNTPSTQCKVRISDASNSAINDVSDNVFTIRDLLNPGSAYFRGWGRIRVTDASPINPSANPSAYKITGNNITVEAWVFPFKLPIHKTGYEIVTRPIWNQNPYVSYALELSNWSETDNPRYQFYITDGDSLTPNGVALDGNTAVAGNWTHLAGTYDGNSVKLYVNGILANETSYYGGIGPGNTGLYIGGLSWNFFYGLIDEVRIWNITRNQSEIQSTMNTTLNGNESGLVGYWPLNEATTVNGIYPVTIDSTINHNDLQVQYTASFVKIKPLDDVSVIPELLEMKVLETTVGSTFTWEVPYYGWPVPDITLLSGPPGMSYNNFSKKISWSTQTGQTGYHNFTLQAVNSAGSLQKTYTIWVDATPLLHSEHNNNNTILSVFNDGTIGNTHYGGGFGFIFKGKNGLMEGDVLVAKSPDQVSGQLYGREYARIKPISTLQSHIAGFDQAFQTEFNDHRAPSNI